MTILIMMFFVGLYLYKFKDRNLEILNQPMTPYIPFSCKVKLPKPDHGKLKIVL